MRNQQALWENQTKSVFWVNVLEEKSETCTIVVFRTELGREYQDERSFWG